MDEDTFPLIKLKVNWWMISWFHFLINILAITASIQSGSWLCPWHWKVEEVSDWNGVWKKSGDFSASDKEEAVWFDAPRWRGDGKGRVRQTAQNNSKQIGEILLLLAFSSSFSQIGETGVGKHERIAKLENYSIAHPFETLLQEAVRQDKPNFVHLLLKHGWVRLNLTWPDLTWPLC